MRFSFVILAIALGAWEQTQASLPSIQTDPSVFSLDELIDREIAAGSRIEMEIQLDPQKLADRFKKCIPVESQIFNGQWNESLDSRIFTTKELSDLMKCNSKSCAHNFLPQEIDQLTKAQTESERIQLFKQFYKNRYLRQASVSPERARFLIRTKDRPFQICQSTRFNQLLDDRPNTHWPMRLSLAHYDQRMRPTTRLLQGDFYTSDSGDLCFADAFVYSNHYDLDRIEVWRWKQSSPSTGSLELQVRHRIDLLNTWYRRLNKGALREELRQIVENHVRQAASCLSSKP
jgi:hypothetical protein